MCRHIHVLVLKGFALRLSRELRSRTTSCSFETALPNPSRNERQVRQNSIFAGDPSPIAILLSCRSFRNCHPWQDFKRHRLHRRHASNRGGARIAIASP
jgi:hypothetical protein